MQAIRKAKAGLLTDDVRVELAQKMPVEFGRLVYNAVRLSPGLSYIVRDIKPFTEDKRSAQRASENIREYLSMRFDVVTYEIAPIANTMVEIRRIEKNRSGIYQPHGGILIPSGIESWLLSSTIRQELGQMQRRVMETGSLPRSETVYGRVTVVEKQYLEMLTELLGDGMSNLLRASTIKHSTFQPDIVFAQESIMGANNPRFEIMVGQYHSKILHGLSILLEQVMGGHYIDEITRQKIIGTIRQFKNELGKTREHIPDEKSLPYMV